MIPALWTTICVILVPTVCHELRIPPWPNVTVILDLDWSFCQALPVPEEEEEETRVVCRILAHPINAIPRRRASLRMEDWSSVSVPPAMSCVPFTFVP
jgi:hypothetical protein